MDHEAFEQPLAVCELTRCRATCCHDGVVLSEEEGKILSDLGGGDGIMVDEDGKIRSKTRPASAAQVARDFPAHFPRTRCVFLDEAHRCRWQLRAVEEGRPAWYYKPISCWLHPLLIAKRGGRAVLTLRSREQDEARFASHTPCGRASDAAAPARESLAMELEMLSELSGRNFYGELNAPPGFLPRAYARSSG